MKNLSAVGVILVLIQSVTPQNFNQIVNEGDICELSNREKGTCIRLSLCSSAREILNQDKIPDNCGFINSVPIACCPKTSRRTTHLAQKKCKKISSIADTFNPENLNPYFPFRLKFPTNTNSIPTDFSRFPVEKEVENTHPPKEEIKNIPSFDFSRFPSEEEIEDTQIPKKQNKNVVSFDLSRFPVEEEIETAQPPKKETKNVVSFDLSRFPLEEETQTTPSTRKQIKSVVSFDFSRFPVEEEIENPQPPKKKIENEFPFVFSRFPVEEEPTKTTQPPAKQIKNDFPLIFSRFPAEEEIENKFNSKHEHTNIIPVDFSRFNYDEDESIENNYRKRYVEDTKSKINSRRNQNAIPIDFSRFNYSPTNDAGRHVSDLRKFASKSLTDLVQFERRRLPKLDTSLKAISEIIIRETPNHVLGGENTKLSEFPHMAALGFQSGKDKLWLCGGSLISDQYVLTAAHCLISIEYGPLTWIRLGNINRDTVSEHEDYQDIKVEKVIPHPQYRYSVSYHDIALVKLERKAIINSFVNIACLYTEEKVPNHLELWATGWGLTTEGGNQSEILKKVKLDLFSEAECNSVYRVQASLKYGLSHNQQICAGGRVNNKDTCKGDSGGPLQIKIKNGDEDTYYIVGITSFGKQCGQMNVPAVYTRVSYYIPWIEKELK